MYNSSNYNNIEKIYDTHAANMYGCIYKIVQDKHQAEKILINIFHDFVTNNPSNVHTTTAPIWFIKYAMKSTFLYLKKMKPTIEVISSFRDVIFKQANKY